jgi:hypothetical protein
VALQKPLGTSTMPLLLALSWPYSTLSNDVKA